MKSVIVVVLSSILLSACASLDLGKPQVSCHLDGKAFLEKSMFGVSFKDRVDEVDQLCKKLKEPNVVG